MRSLSMSSTFSADDLGDAQAGAIGDRQRGLVLEAGGGVEQPGDLVAAQHHGQLARMRQPDQPARQVGPVERVGEEEAQRRDDAVHGRHRNAGLALLDLEPAQVVRGRRIGRSSEERGEPSDVADVVALRLPREPAHGHVVDQPLAQRADRGASRTGWCIGRLLVEEAAMLCPQPNDAQRERNDPTVTSTSPRAPSRAAGSFFGPLRSFRDPLVSSRFRPKLTFKANGHTRPRVRTTALWCSDRQTPPSVHATVTP